MRNTSGAARSSHFSMASSRAFNELTFQVATRTAQLSPSPHRLSSVQCERPCDDLAGGPVGAHHNTCGGCLAVDQLQPGGDGAIAEQALSGPDDEGEDPEAEL